MQRAALGILALILVACAPTEPSAWAINRETTGPSRLPLALKPSAIGSYSRKARSGAGYFYDDVLEYRVWLHPGRGAEQVSGDEDYFAAFAQYERAVTFSKVTSGADAPLVLVSQREWIDEPEPGRFVRQSGERITEWQVRSLAGSKREMDSIARFLANPQSAIAARAVAQVKSRK
jgi:hypothetical protein